MWLTLGEEEEMVPNPASCRILEEQSWNLDYKSLCFSLMK